MALQPAWCREEEKTMNGRLQNEKRVTVTVMDATRPRLDDINVVQMSEVK